jgi:tRNA threonylcarbamoyl adenosine modification protein YjeE
MLLRNEGDTEKLAKRLVKLSKQDNTVICLNGDLGSGKTTFTRYFIRNFFKGIEFKEIPSPTFTLLQVYENDSHTINHYDFYRLKNSSELFELNFREAVTDDVCLIEWSDKFEEILPNDRIEISFQIKSKFSRSVKITLRGKFKNQKY